MNISILACIYHFLIVIWPKSNIVVRIQQQYGRNIRNLVHKTERIYLNLKKVELDIDFILKCQKASLIPSFCKMKLSNRNSLTQKEYKSIQEKVLSVELRSKRRSRQRHYNVTSSIYRALKEQ